MTVECLFFISWCINGAWVEGRAIMRGSGVSTTTLKGDFFGGITLLIDWFLHQGALLSFFSFSFWEIFSGSFLLSYHRE